MRLRVVGVHGLLKRDTEFLAYRLELLEVLLVLVLVLDLEFDTCCEGVSKRPLETIVLLRDRRASRDTRSIAMVEYFQYNGNISKGEYTHPRKLVRRMGSR